MTLPACTTFHLLSSLSQVGRSNDTGNVWLVYTGWYITTTQLVAQSRTTQFQCVWSLCCVYFCKLFLTVFSGENPLSWCAISMGYVYIFVAWRQNYYWECCVAASASLLTKFCTHATTEKTRSFVYVHANTHIHLTHTKCTGSTCVFVSTICEKRTFLSGMLPAKQATS